MPMSPSLFPTCEYVVMDVETTGLYPEDGDGIIQIAWMLLDKDMKPIAQPHSFGCVFVDNERPASEWGSKDGLIANGLLVRYLECKAKAACMHRSVVDAVLYTVVKHGATLVAVNPGFVRGFLDSDLPEMEGNLSKTRIDVGAMRSMRAKVLGVNEHKAIEGFGYKGDAWADTLSCFAELHFYRGLFGKAVP